MTSGSTLPHGGLASLLLCTLALRRNFVFVFSYSGEPSGVTAFIIVICKEVESSRIVSNSHPKPRTKLTTLCTSMIRCALSIIISPI